MLTGLGQAAVNVVQNQKKRHAQIASRAVPTEGYLLRVETKELLHLGLSAVQPEVAVEHLLQCLRIGALRTEAVIDAQDGKPCL